MFSTFIGFNKKDGGGQDIQGGGQDNPGYLDPRESSCPGGQDKLLHRFSHVAAHLII